LTVYFIGGDFDRVKIGFTAETNPNGRLRDLQTGSPVQLRVLAACPGAQEDERALHDALAKERQHGEWFKISERVGVLIKFAETSGRLDGWQAVLADHGAASDFGATHGTCAGFAELRGLPDHAVTFRLKGKRRKLPPTTPWDVLLALHWPEDTDEDHLVHHVRQGFGTCWEFGWERLTEGYVDMHGRAGPRHTGQLLSWSAGSRSHEMAVWIQACLRDLDPPRIRASRTELATKLPGHEALRSAAYAVNPCEWHYAATYALPEPFELPEYCSLSAEEFVRLVARHRKAIWNDYALHAVWLERAHEPWPRTEAA
jgi:hypothetical protein